MSNIKEVITCLCKILHLTLDVNVKPEHFRLAKFNKVEDNVVSQLWQILHNIVHRVEYINHVFDGGDLITCIKLNFIQLAYESIDFYSLPSDMSYGSRELLLALGWLLVSENCIEKLVLKKIRMSELGKEFVHNSSSQDIQWSIPTAVASIDDQLNYITWLAGKIKSNISGIEEANKTRTKLLAQIHADSIGTCGLPHISVLEASLVQQPQFVQKHLALVDASAQLIDAYRQWQLKEHTFWEWMESVLEEKLKSTSSHSINITEKTHLLQVLNALHLKVKSFIKTQENHLKKGIQLMPSSSCLSLPSAMPRFLFAAHESETELHRWIPDSEQRIQALEQQFQHKEEVMMKELSNILKQMKNIHVISRQSKVLNEEGASCKHTEKQLPSSQASPH